MVETRLVLEPEVIAALAAADSGRCFLLSGGAGSGKTYSLVKVINQVLLETPSSQIACMTYTNAAVREIASRVDSPNLTVTTIHEFLWNILKGFQTELKDELILLINDNVENPAQVLPAGFFSGKSIQYKEYVRLQDAIISHDEVLLLADRMFAKYVKLCNILADRFNYIFVDEYQDASAAVIRIFLNHLEKSTRPNVVGFFGDSMQAIYDEGVGDIAAYVASGKVLEIKKAQNRRNPKSVFDLANRLRNDGIIQVPSSDPTAPNMENGSVVLGDIKFYYSMGVVDELENIKAFLKWDFDHAKENRELNLTHNLIAPRAGFDELMEIYDADKVLDYKKRVVDYIRDNNVIINAATMTFGQVLAQLKISYPEHLKKINPTPGQKKFIDMHPALYAKACNMPYELLRGTYVDKDALIDDKKDDPSAIGKAGGKRDRLIKHLFKIQSCISLYVDGFHNEFLRKSEFKIRSVGDKRRLLEIVSTIEGMGAASIESVIDYADMVGICKKDDSLNAFISQKEYLYDRVKNIEFSQFQNLHRYLEGRTPFSTQHKIKGAEFDNVLVVLNNGNWAKYNFQTLLEGVGNESVLARTRKLFYVCCTRAKRNLVVYYHQPTEASLARARVLFGGMNVKEFGGAAAA
jgi:DNA helicase-2/ATP-dependent DNA helicase PcrA